MVMSMNRTNRTKRIVGDGKRIILRTNSDSLLVIGSGNSVEIEQNDGSVQVVGDGCRVSIRTGSGSVEYIGDGGYLKTGSVDLKNVKYSGDGGKIVTDDGVKQFCKTKLQESKQQRATCTSIYSKSETSKTVSYNIRNKVNCRIELPEISIRVPKISVYKKCKCKNGQ